MCSTYQSTPVLWHWAGALGGQNSNVYGTWCAVSEVWRQYTWWLTASARRANKACKPTGARCHTMCSDSTVGVWERDGMTQRSWARARQGGHHCRRRLSKAVGCHGRTTTRTACTVIAAGWPKGPGPGGLGKQRELRDTLSQFDTACTGGPSGELEPLTTSSDEAPEQRGRASSHRPLPSRWLMIAW